jgi:hypothetical protein
MPVMSATRSASPAAARPSEAAVMASRTLGAQDWLDHLDDDTLAAVYRGRPPDPGT